MQHRMQEGSHFNGSDKETRFLIKRGEPRNSQNAMFFIEPKVWRGSHFTNVQAEKDENTTLWATSSRRPRTLNGKMHKYQSRKKNVYIFFALLPGHLSCTWRLIRGFKGQRIKQVELPFVPFPRWIRSHPLICSINGRKVDAPQLTGFNVHFHVQCGVKMWIDLACWVTEKQFFWKERILTLFIDMGDRREQRESQYYFFPRKKCVLSKPVWT